MARVLQEFFQIDLRIAESRSGLSAGGLHGVHQGCLGVDNPHAAPATAASGLDDHRVTDSTGDLDDFLRVIGQGAFRARYTGYTGADHRLLGRYLVAHHPDGFGCRANEGKAAALDALGKVSVFAQETVAGMDRLGVRYFGSRDDGRHAQIALRRCGRTDADRLIGQLHILGVAVGFGINHHRLDAHFAAGALDPEGDLASISNQYFFEHRSSAQSP